MHTAEGKVLGFAVRKMWTRFLVLSPRSDLVLPVTSDRSQRPLVPLWKPLIQLETLTSSKDADSIILHYIGDNIKRWSHCYIINAQNVCSTCQSPENITE